MDRAAYIRSIPPAKYKALDATPFGEVKPYHVSFCAEMESRFTFEGKRVLEVGGSLSKSFVLDELKVASWTGVQELDYWRSINRDIGSLQSDAVPSFEALTPDRIGPYQIVTAAIETLPRHLYKQFDIVISMAAFSFLHQVGAALDKIYGALRPGGAFGVMTGQVWSSDEGHFFHTVEDSIGRPFSAYKLENHRNPVPPWGHLLMTPPEMYMYLSRFMNSEAAGAFVYNTYTHPRINRIFADDYNAYFEMSPFGRRGKVESHLIQQDLPDAALQKRLEARHPGKRNFNSRALFAYMQRLTED